MVLKCCSIVLASKKRLVGGSEYPEFIAYRLGCNQIVGHSLFMGAHTACLISIFMRKVSYTDQVRKSLIKGYHGYQKNRDK